MEGPASFLISMRDVTWHVQQEEELSQAKDRLEVEVQSSRDELLHVNESLRAEVVERRRAEMALRESERKYRQIVELAQEGIWIIDRKAVIRFVNPKLADMLGHKAEEMMGRSSYDFIDVASRDAQKKAIERRKQGIRESYDCDLVKKDGTKLVTIASAATIIDEDGNYSGSLAMFTDITRRRQSEEELKEAKAQAELYLDLMGHDIRNLSQIGMGYIRAGHRAGRERGRTRPAAEIAGLAGGYVPHHRQRPQSSSARSPGPGRNRPSTSAKCLET